MSAGLTTRIMHRLDPKTTSLLGLVVLAAD